jgi:hypothetical protein
MIGKITKEQFEEKKEEIIVEVLGSNKFPKDEYFETPISDDMYENYHNLALKLTYRLNRVMDREWRDFETISSTTVKNVKSLTEMYSDLINIERDKKQSNQNSSRISHSQIQQKLREIERYERDDLVSSPHRKREEPKRGLG